MPDRSIEMLRYAHAYVGQMVGALLRVGVAFIAMGCVVAMAYPTVQNLIQTPEKTLQAQAFEINYLEMVKRTHNVNDPDWDGAVSGMCLGYSLTRGFPFVIPAFGALAGAVVEYELDTQM